MVQLKWKCIISNWINCYFYDNNNKHEPQVNQELLLNIIDHLRQNFNLDESKSSIFSGQTLEEFIAEKFPGFTFENGTLQAITEDDIFIAASLLLFFVCVNSKDVNIKSAMCSKLSASDQKVILKFSKTLMECSKITALDVVAAITEACGPDMSTSEGSRPSLVAETPPALRSLHGEVRRLQAALDAERFDRNYLQDELTRTNLKLEKLVKDKEQYKTEIVNLKAKISICCGQEDDARGGDTDSSEISKLKKQLQEMEQSLCDVREELDEVKHERDTLKTKLDNLKCECDRLIVLNQQESTQATQLAEELENERQLSHSLRELVAELRQHNQRNRLDTSMPECDDTNTSVELLQRSFSVDNENIANVVEVQLGEERAKIESLKQQIHLLQDECNEQQQNVNTFKKIIADKENEIFGLKHRINEEIEDKNNLKISLDNEITTLNNVVNELEQKLKSQSEQCKLINEKHVHEVQTLQEEKMSLIQSLTDQVRKSDVQIKVLKEELDTEKASKNNMRDDYENHVMKLKEKVLNRNNELVELQNKILQKSEVIEQISLDLRKEKELNNAKINELTNDFAVLNGQKTELEKDLQDKCLEITKLLEDIHKRDISIDNLNKDLDCFKTLATNLKEECRILEETKQSLLDDVQNRQISAEKMRKELDNLRQMHSEEKDKLQCKVDEMCAMVKSLQTQLQNEIDFKMGLQHELEKTQGVITKLSNTNTKLNTELAETVTKMQDKEEIIKSKDLTLQEERENSLNLKQNLDEVKVNIEKITNEVMQKNQIIEQCDKLNKSLQEEIAKNSEIISTLHTELANVNEEKISLQTFIESLRHEKDTFINEQNILFNKEKEKHDVLKQEYNSLQTFVELLKNEKDNIIKEKDLLLNNEKEMQAALKKECETLQTIIESLKIEKDKIVNEKDLLLNEGKETHEILRKECETLQSFIESLKNEKDKIIKEKDLLLQKEKDSHDVLKNEYDNLQTEKNEIRKEIDLLLRKEKETHEVHRKECDSLQTFVDSLKIEKDKFVKETDLLLFKEKETHDVLKKEYDSLQIFVESLKKENDEIVKKKDILLHQIKEEYEVLKMECDSLKLNLEKVTIELNLKEKIIQDCNNNLEQLNTSFLNKVTYCNEVIDSLKKDLVKVNAERQTLQDMIKSLTDEKNYIIAENEEILHKEKEMYNKLKQDDENIKKELIKVSNELTMKHTLLKEYEDKLINLNNYCQTENSKYTEKINKLNQDLTNANAQKQNLQDSIHLVTQEKDAIIKETEILLQTEKEMHRKLKQDFDKLNKEMEQLTVGTKEKDNVIQKCETELRHLGKCLQDEINKNTKVITSINGDLKSVNAEKENLHITLRSLNDEKNNLIKIVNEKTKIISELESEREALSRKMEEKGATIHSLEQKLQDKMLGFVEIENNFGIEISKLMTKLSDAEKTFKDIKAKSNKIIENQELQIQSLNGDIFSLKGKLESSQKEIGKMEKNLKEMNMKYDKKEKDYRNKCQSLQDVNNQMRNEIAFKETNISELKKKNTLLSSLVAEREKELSILRDANNEWKCKKQVIDDNLRTENERLMKIIEELNSKTEELGGELNDKSLKINNLEEEIKAYNNERATLEKEKCLYKALLVELEQEKENLISENRKLESEKEELVEGRNNLESNLIKLKTNLDELKNYLVRLEEEKTVIVYELERTKSDMNTCNELNTQLKQEKETLEIEKTDLIEERNWTLSRIDDVEKEKLVLQNEVIPKLKEDNLRLTKSADQDKTVIENLEKLIEEKTVQNETLIQSHAEEKVDLTNKYQLLEDNLKQAESNVDERNAEINGLRKELEMCISEAKQRETELQENNQALLEQFEEKDIKIHKLMQDLEIEKATTSRCQQELQGKEIRILELKQRLNIAETENRKIIQNEKMHFTETLRKKDEECALLRNENNEWKIKMDALEVEFEGEKVALQNELQTQVDNNEKLVNNFEVTIQQTKELQQKMTELKQEIDDIKNDKENILKENNLLIQDNDNNNAKLNDLQKELDDLQNVLTQVKEDNLQLKNILETYESEITTLEKLIQNEKKQNDQVFEENIDKLDNNDKCKILQECNTKIGQMLEQRNKEINALKEEIVIVTSEANARETDLKEKNEILTKTLEEKDDVILKINEELAKEKILNIEYQKQVQSHENAINELEKKLCQLKDDAERNNREIINDADRSVKCDEVEARGPEHRPPPDTQVHNSSSDFTHSATEKNKIISDLERILNDKNRTISNLNSDITYLKSLMAESESDVLDKNKELESTRENYQQLSLQLKKIVHQKNEEIMDLKKQITKMSLTENRASQIIKVSAKYQDIIQKRIAEIKSDTALKELTNFGNAANGDFKRSLSSGSITMEDLENFLETTDRHLRRCAEKRAALQKERDRLLEVNRINESDVINIKKFLTELSVGVKTFNSYKEMYSQKMSRVILLQRTVRREILKVEERLCEEVRCRLERTYAAVMQDLVECALNMERWVERCFARTFSSEKMKQAFMSDLDRASFAPASFQSAALEAQIDELENSFQKVLEEVARALKGEGASDGRRGAAAGGTVAEVRAEYEDKLTRMKTKMKELYSQEIEVFKERQRREVEALEREVAATRARLADTSGAYEDHIRGLTSELWRLGERLVERDEDRPRAPRTPRALRAPSLLSLQQVPASGAAAHAADQSRVSDTHSLRSLPLNINNKKKEGRGLHMSDEEGEVFDNRYLRELRSPGAARGEGATPRARGDPALRLSELRWRNSLCLPHLKSSYPAETQFVAAHEDEIKAVPANASVGGRQQRKEVGITAYKKPGPPTPSKQAGRLSATDCELRESLRVEAEPQGAGGAGGVAGAQGGRRTATPSRLRALFTSNRSDADGTPRSRRLSNFFRKK